MPKRYKFDGTAMQQVKKRYKFDGTAMQQVKKRYKFDGTTMQLVYSADLTVAPNPTEFPASAWTKLRGDVNVGTDAAQTVIYGSVNNYGVTGAVVAIDVSDYSKLTIVGTVTVSTNTYQSYPVIGLAPLSFWTNAAAVYNPTVGGLINADPSTTVSINKEYDISSLSGVYYVGARLRPSASADWYTPSFDFTQIILT